MSTRIRPVTTEELLHMPHDGFRYELVRGELRKMPPAGDEHGYIAGRYLENSQHVAVKVNRRRRRGCMMDGCPQDLREELATAEDVRGYFEHARYRQTGQPP
jgi:hypothetical protein